MKHLVVDASVAIKWFLPEVHSIAAVRLLESHIAFSAPDLILPELGNALWKRIRRGEMTRGDASEIISAMERIGIEITPSMSLLPPALDLAHALNRTVYDCLYLSLAIARDCQVVTADRKFHSAVNASRVASHIVWIEDVS
jgi:predicted nucleic acid-binding protein